MRTNVFTFTVMAILVAVVGWSRPAVAQDQSVAVEVRAISASEEGSEFDNNLSDLKSKLEKAFGSYSSFEQVGSASVDVAEGESESIDLPGDHSMEVTYHGPADDLAKIGLEIAGKMSTTLRASPGSTFFQAGLDYRDGILILAITVED